MDGITVVTKALPIDAPQEFSKDEINPIAGLVGLDTHNLNDTDKTSLRAIYDFVRGDSKEMTEMELLHQVRQLENRLGFPNLGERRIDKIYRYVKLQSQIENLTKSRDRELR